MSQAGVINIEAANPQIPTQFITDIGTSVAIGNTLEILGDNGITTTGSGKTITITGINATAGANELLASKGVASFDSASFTVTNGFVEFIGGSGGIDSIITNDGVPGIEPDISGNIQLIGGQGIIVTGQAPSNIGTISGIDATIVVKGIVEIATNAETITGTLTDYHVINPSSLKAKLGVQTAQGVMISKGTTAAIESTAAGTTGQLLIAATGANPAFGTIAYNAGFTFSNLTPVNPISLGVNNTDNNAASTADIHLATPAGGADSMVIWEVSGGAGPYYSAGVDNSSATDDWKLTTSSDPSGGVAALAVTNATGAVTFASAYTFPVADGGVGTVLTTDGTGAVTWQAAGSGGVNQNQIYYVGKHGNDANSGLNIEEAKLTFGSAITDATAMTPSAVNRFVIECFDDGIYSEIITCVSFVDIYAPSATLDLTGLGDNGIYCVDNSDVKFHRLIPDDTFSGAIKSVGTDETNVDVDITIANGTSIGFTCGVNQTMHVNFKQIFIQDGKGLVLCSTFNGGDIFINGDGFGIDNNDAGTPVHSNFGTLNRIVLTGGGTGANIAVNLNGTTNLIAHFLSTSTTFYMRDTTTVINCFCTRAINLTVTTTGNAVYNFWNLDLTSNISSITSFTKRSVGATHPVHIINTDNTNAASGAALTISTQGSSAGDPYTNYLVTGGSQFSQGIDNSDADSLKITDGATPSAGNTTWKMTTAGERTMPLQPAFLAYRNANLANQTGNSALVTIPFDTEVYDQNADYNNGTYTFTSSVTGKYQFNVCVGVYALSNVMTEIQITLVTSNRSYRGDFSNPYAQSDLKTGSNIYVKSFSVLADMDALDTAYVTIKVIGGVGDSAGILGVDGADASLLTFFSGYLVC